MGRDIPLPRMQRMQGKEPHPVHTRARGDTGSEMVVYNVRGIRPPTYTPTQHARIFQTDPQDTTVLRRTLPERGHQP
eukprot:1972525-Rhodomonas_salina.1